MALACRATALAPANARWRTAKKTVGSASNLLLYSQHESDRRKSFACIFGFFARVDCLYPVILGQGTELNIKKLKNELYVIEGTSNGSGDVGNVAVYVTSEGVILVDDRFAQDYDLIVAAVKRVTSQPIRYVINTHHHGDHTGSNLRFLATSELIAHTNARKHMLEGNMPGPPQITFTNQTSVFLGGKEVRAIYYGRGHTDGDIAVYFPAEQWFI